MYTTSGDLIDALWDLPRGTLLCIERPIQIEVRSADTKNMNIIRRIFRKNRKQLRPFGPLDLNLIGSDGRNFPYDD